MARVTFKAKIKHVKYVDGTPAASRLNVPMLHRGHCDMPAFRQHSKLGWLANSDMFEATLNKQAKALLGECVRLDNIPDGVTVDTSGFLAVVSFEL